MARYLTPQMFRVEDAGLSEAFVKIAEAQGLANTEADLIFGSLPPTIQQAPAFKDKLTNLWRYEYAVPYVVGKGSNRTSLVGTNIAHKASVLFNGLRTLRSLVSDAEYRRFCKRLGDKGRHLDFLAELDPIMRPSVQFTADYEVQGYARGHRKIDWHIRFEDATSCLIDVKHRLRGLLTYIEQIVPGLNRGDQFVPAQAPLPEGIFKSSEDKFLPGAAGRWQGVWIVTDVYYNEEALIEQFCKLDPARIQFAVLTHFGGEARILTKQHTLKQWLTTKFCLIEMAKR